MSWFSDGAISNGLFQSTAMFGIVELNARVHQACTFEPS
jgi:hypothetical protein